MWIAAVLGALIVGYVLLVARTAKLNADPLQQELAGLLMEMMASGADQSAQALFSVSATNRFIRSMVVDRGAQQTRLAHALSLCRPSLSEQDYQRARMIVRDF